ncbi:MAG: hypothetical protein IH820_12515, partial [Bacteroidetes bacterium]|nr:hypothetical protein [Bacteroidota bacterium]
MKQGPNRTHSLPTALKTCAVWAVVSAGLAAVLVWVSTPAVAQTLSLDFGQGGDATARIIQIIALITILSLAPSILVMVTSFIRIMVVLSFLRTAMGTQQT